MEATVIPRVKICCIATVAEAWLAIRCGASALGLVSAMPSGPGVISEEVIAGIAAAVPPPIATFLLTARQRAEDIITQHRHCRTSTLQLCDRLEPGAHERLRAALPGITLVQVIHVNGEASVAEAIAVAPLVDVLLLDSGNQALPVKELGGTGRTHDWTLSRRIRELVPVPVFLAGGLRPDNAAAAASVVQPFGLDLCSSVRTEGRLDETKLRNFFAALARPPESVGHDAGML